MGFFDWLSLITVGGFAVGIVFLILFALPKNTEFRSAAMKIVGIGGVALGVVSPIDLIPDPLLGLGQLDDLGYISLGIYCAVSLVRQLLRKGDTPPKELASLSAPES